MWAVGANSPSGYLLTRSLRFRSSASAYLNRTVSSTTNRKTWTASFWVKLGSVTAPSAFMSTPGSTDADYFRIGYSISAVGALYISAFNSATFCLETTALLRDPSAWYHVIVATDTTQATASNRCKVYINGVQVTSFVTANYPAQNFDTAFSFSSIGERIGIVGSSYYDGLLSEFNFIDGQALSQNSFGKIDPVTGVWRPVKYTGTYGTNGFYLPFTDNSALTTASNVGIGKDFSGNTNYFTTNNISITAGTTYDSFVDVPTLTSSAVGNFATLNPVNKGTSVTLSQASLVHTSGTDANCRSLSTIGMTSGKWYCEYTTLDTSVYHLVGIAIDTEGFNAGYVGATSGSYGFYASNGQKYSNGVTLGYGSTWNGLGKVVSILFDADNRTLSFWIDGVSQGIAYSGIPAGTFYFAQGNYASSYTGAFNFGQRPFIYTPTAGFLALNTYNLPDPTIRDGNKHFGVVLRNGFGASGGSVTSLQFQPDLVWEKSRNTVNEPWLVDSTRGPNTLLRTSMTNADLAAPTLYTSFNSNGYSLGASDHAGSATVVGWTWKKSATAGLDIVTYVGNATNRTIAHSLGVTPKLIIVKDRSGVNNWLIWHAALAGTEYLNLNTSDAKLTSAAVWNSTTPTSSVFSVGTSSGSNNNGANIIAYLWSEIPDFSKFGRYVGNGSVDGPFVYCGFRPRFIMVKDTTAANTWIMWDSARDVNNVAGLELYPNSTAAEPVNSLDIDILSNGFKVRRAATNFNTSTNVYIFAAFAENPFKYALAR